jgi:ADP-L-glycero-D-manno-heptose 6-epimerase
METDGRYMLDNNYRYSLELLRWCQQQDVPLIYASSAAVYGLGPTFVESRANERPLNIYGYSKFLFDQVVRRELPRFKAPVIGLRYFNVRAARSHKGAWRLSLITQPAVEGAAVRGQPWLRNGEQRRDFIHVEDVVNANLHFWDRPVSGIYNLGTGRAQAFNDVALTVVSTLREHAGQEPLPLTLAVQEGLIEYIPFPEALKGKYQAHTQADLEQLRAAGCEMAFQTVEHGTRAICWLPQNRMTGHGAGTSAAFLDRDGVINIDRGYVSRREDFTFVPGVIEGARQLHELGYALVVVTNQSGIGRGHYSKDAFDALTAWMKAEFAVASAPLAGVYFCPHHPSEAVGDYRRECDCRKPAPGMLFAAARELGIRLSASAMFGDKTSDLEAARAAGVSLRVLLGTDARETPPLPTVPGLASASFRRLDEALMDPALRSSLDARNRVTG